MAAINSASAKGIWAHFEGMLPAGEYAQLRDSVESPGDNQSPPQCMVCAVPCSPFVYLGNNSAAECSGAFGSNNICQNCAIDLFQQPLQEGRTFHQCPFARTSNCNVDHTAAFTRPDPFRKEHPQLNAQVEAMLVPCPRGCGAAPMRLGNGAMADDERSALTNHYRNECDLRQVDACANEGCCTGVFPMTGAAYATHRVGECNRRLVPCPIAGCTHAPLAADELDGHVVTCHQGPDAVIHLQGRLLAVQQEAARAAARQAAQMARLQRQVADALAARAPAPAAAPAPEPAAAPAPAGPAGPRRPRARARRARGGARPDAPGAHSPRQRGHGRRGAHGDLDHHRSQADAPLHGRPPGLRARCGTQPPRRAPLAQDHQGPQPRPPP